MDQGTSLSIGFFETGFSFFPLLHALSTTVGYQIICCSPAYPSPSAFLGALLDQLKQAQPAPYDLLLLAIPAAELGGQTRLLLEALVSCERLPVIVLTASPFHERAPLLTHVPVKPFLSRAVFRPQDLVTAWETATDACCLWSDAAISLLAQWMKQHVQEAIDAHQTWIDRRRHWLRQRQEWVHHRHVWLYEQEAWLDQQSHDPERQDEWFAEQRAWIQAQQHEVRQQEHRFHRKRHWVAQQQRKLDLVKRAISLSSSFTGEDFAQDDTPSENSGL